MEDPILITWLNDYVFCPKSIYYHNLYGTPNEISFQESSQINGKNAHESLDSGTYSTKRTILTGLFVYCERYGLIGKIDCFDADAHALIERKKKIKTVYDGYVFQLYGQYYAMQEMGYCIKKLFLHSLDDNKRIPVPLPEDDPQMEQKFEAVIQGLHEMDVDSFVQSNPEKCARCIYEPLCDCDAVPEA